MITINSISPASLPHPLIESKLVQNCSFWAVTIGLAPNAIGNILVSAT